jgi:hypothetical protein
MELLSLIQASLNIILYFCKAVIKKRIKKRHQNQSHILDRTAQSNLIENQVKN